MTRARHIYLFGFLALALVAVALIYVLLPSRSSEFALAYAAYREVASAHDTVAYYPSVVDNEVRQNLNRSLALALADTVSAQERITEAQKGLGYLAEAEAQIDAMGELAPRVEATILALEESESALDTLQTHQAIDDVVALARRRLEIIADIRGLSYKANFYTEGILKQVIADEGALTPEYVLFLNSEIPQVEAQFDERSNLYRELESVRVEIENTARAFDE